MKWLCCTMVLNEIHYLPYWIKSIYDFADKIVIVEGATKYVADTEKTKEGLSVDGTTEWIKKFIEEKDKDKKVIYIPVGNVPTKVELQNEYVKKIEELNPDWVILNGGDEVWRKQDLERLDKHIIDNPDLEYIFCDQYWFWGDMHHYVTIKSDYYNTHLITGHRKMFCDKNGKKLAQGMIHERIFKWHSGMKYHTSHANICDPKGVHIYIDKQYEKKREYLPWLRWFHYGNIKPINEIKDQYKYYMKRGFKKTTEEQFRAGYISNIDLAYLRKPYSLFCKHTRSIYDITSLEVEHPECIKKHPWFNKCVHVISKKEDLDWLYGLNAV